MGVADFEDALKKDAGIPLKASTREKLEKKDAGLLTELKEAILESDKTLEQERLLWGWYRINFNGGEGFVSDKYALAVNYNSSCTPGAGSAIFFHCSRGSSTAGCIAISESNMIQLMQNLRGDCIIVIDSASNINNY